MNSLGLETRMQINSRTSNLSLPHSSIMQTMALIPRKAASSIFHLQVWQRMTIITWLMGISTEGSHLEAISLEGSLTPNLEVLAEIALTSSRWLEGTIIWRWIRLKIITQSQLCVKASQWTTQWCLLERVRWACSPLPLSLLKHQALHQVSITRIVIMFPLMLRATNLQRLEATHIINNTLLLSQQPQSPKCQPLARLWAGLTPTSTTNSDEPLRRLRLIVISEWEQLHLSNESVEFIVSTNITFSLWLLYPNFRGSLTSSKRVL